MTSHTVIILGGNSASNKIWVDDMCAHLNPDFNVATHEYLHWKGADHDIDFDIELARLERFIKRNNIKEYSIVAKSAGLLLSLIGVGNGVLFPVSIVGFGLPLEYARYRKVDISSLIADISKEHRILIIQGTRDPQGYASAVRQIIPNNILLTRVRSDSHAYDNFKKMSRYAQTFIMTNQPEEERVFPEAQGSSLNEAVLRVHRSRGGYRPYSAWMYDPFGYIRAFTYGEVKYIAKRTSYSKAVREKDNAEEAFKRLDGTSIGNRTIAVVVPSSLVMIDNETCYLVSEYKSADYNGCFYLQRSNITLSANEVKLIVEEFANKGVIYSGFLPRNTIVTDSNIFLIDWEDAEFSDTPVMFDVLLKTNYLIGWSLISKVLPILEQSGAFKEPGENLLTGEYEKVFLNMLGSKSSGVGNLKTMPYMNAISAESYVSGDGVGGRLKRYDIVCALSPFIPIEVEVFIDILLARDAKLRSDLLHEHLSNAVRSATLESHCDVSATTVNARLLKTLRSIVRSHLKYNKVSVPGAITSLYDYGEPNKDTIDKIARFLAL